MQMEYPISDLARVFPDMPPEDFARLVASIQEDGLMDPITVWQGPGDRWPAPLRGLRRGRC